VIACTDDRPLNARVADDARAAGALVNVADDPPLCDFYMPAVVRDGDVIVAIGTGGSCPGLAGMLRERLGPALPPRVGEFAAALADLRAENRDQVGNPERRMSLIKGLADQRGYEAFCRGGLDALRDMLLQPPQPDERPPAADTERAGAPGDGKLLNPPAEPPAAEPPARQ
jgi:siroheme synthase-like protein